MKINLFRQRPAHKIEGYQPYYHLIEGEIVYNLKKIKIGLEMFPKKPPDNRFHFYWSVDISFRKGFNIFTYFNIE